MTMSVSNNDDTWLHIPLYCKNTSKINQLENCLLALHSWFAHNGVAFCISREIWSHSLWIISVFQISFWHFTHRCRWHIHYTIGHGQATRSHLRPSHNLRQTHQWSLLFCSFPHQTRALRYVHSAISDDTEKTVAQTLVSSRFDYVNAILYGAQKYNITKLQQAQHALVWVETRSHRRESANPLCGNSISCLLKRGFFLNLQSKPTRHFY